MNRKEMLRLLLNQAQFNGFEFRRWFLAHVQAAWPGAEQALTLLAGEGRHYTLIFSHEFARCFWRTGAQISFKPDVWKYHLRQTAAAEDPIGYLCRFLPAQDQTWVEEHGAESVAAQA
jgi:hypothetical protein